MKKRACETMELTPNIINEWVSGLSHAGKVNIKNK